MSVTCSICIANYNGIGLIDECLASIRAQTVDFPIEIIVHDDASSDCSVEHLRKNHPEVHLIESETNVGFCVANNRMAAVARGEYLLLLNNDAALFPDALSTLMHEADRLGRFAILSLPQHDTESGALLDIGSLLDPFLNPVPNLDSSRNEVAMVMGACLWIPKTLWNELGGFPEWFGSIAEDLYLCCRARLAGYGVRALSHSGYYHRVGSSFGGGKTRNGRLATTFRRRALSERNKTFVIVMTYPAPVLQFLLPLHLALLLVESVLLTVLHRRLTYLTQVCLPLFRELVRKRELLLSVRKDVMGNRSIGVNKFFSRFSLLPHKLRMFLRFGLPRVD